VFLTEASKKLQDETMDMANQTLNEALEGVTNDDIEICKAVLQNVYDNLK
jgi:DNA-binding MarR family transcriptional regulator